MLCAEIAMHVQLSQMGGTCSWVQHAVQAPCTLLLLCCAVASARPGDSRAQSCLTVAALTAGVTASTSMMLLKDTCFPAILNEKSLSYLSLAVASILHTAVGHTAFPAMVQDLRATVPILWVGTLGTVYIQYLNL